MPKWGGSKAVVVRPDVAESSPARQALIAHLATVAAIQGEHNSAAEAISRLRQILDQETAAEASFAQLHHDHSSALGKWAERGGTGPLPLPDAAQHAKAEAALTQARRSAEAARSAIVEKETSMTAIGARLAAAAERTETLKVAVLIEQADAIGARYVEGLACLAGLAARLRGLNEWLVQTQRRVRPPGQPEMTGIDLGPMQCGDLRAPGFALAPLLSASVTVPSWVESAHRWRALFERLDADPGALLPEEGQS